MRGGGGVFVSTNMSAEVPCGCSDVHTGLPCASSKQTQQLQSSHHVLGACTSSSRVHSACSPLDFISANSCQLLVYKPVRTS